MNGRLRVALGAGGEDQEAGRLGRRLGDRCRAVPEWDVGRLEDHEPRVRELRALGQLGIRHLLDARQRHGADPVQGAEQAEPFGALRQPHRDDVAGSDPAGVEAGRDPARELRQLRVAESVRLPLGADDERPHSGAMTRASPETTRRSPTQARVSMVARRRSGSYSVTSTRTRTSSPGLTGDEVRVRVEVTEYDPERRRATLDTRAWVGDRLVVSGEARVIAPE